MAKTTPWPQSPTDPPAGLGKGVNGARVVNTDVKTGGGNGGDGAPLDGKLVVQRRHIDWLEHQISWRWLLDSFEGGNRYRQACYGPDRRGLPARNLYRHKREYPDPQSNPQSYQGFAGFLGNTGADATAMDVGYGPYPGMLGADPAATAQDDDYEYRRSRTPVPEFVAEAVEYHLAKIYDQEIDRPQPQAARPQPGPILRPPSVLTGQPPAVPGSAPTAPAPGPTPVAPAMKPIGGKPIIPVPQPVHDGPLNPEDPLPPANPPDLIAWWQDVDGRGTPVDDWMRDTVAPLLLVLGCLDVCLDHPKAPPGETIETQADVLRLGLDTCVASYILPQNMVWWRLDAAGRYLECLVREYVDPSDRIDHDKDGNAIDPDGTTDASANWRKDYIRWRYWTRTESIVFDYDGDEVLERTPHSFGCVPIVRLVDYPKHRSPHVGKSRYEAIAEYQREYYNRDSELILNDTLQAHPLLCMPEDYLKADNTVSIGPGYILPMKGNPEKTAYTSPEFVSPPKDPAESLRRNKQDILDLKDRRACLAKPAGAAGGGQGTTVSQSGVSKQLDAVAGHKLLVSIAKSLAKAERQIAEYALVVLRNKPLDPATRKQVQVVYPARFELHSAEEMIAQLITLQQAWSSVGEAPETEREILQTISRQVLLGLTDLDYARLDAEVDLLARSKAALKERMVEMTGGITSQHESMEGGGSAEQAAGEDPTGQSGGTMISNMIPAVV